VHYLAPILVPSRSNLRYRVTVFILDRNAPSQNAMRPCFPIALGSIARLSHRARSRTKPLRRGSQARELLPRFPSCALPISFFYVVLGAPAVPAPTSCRSMTPQAASLRVMPPPASSCVGEVDLSAAQRAMHCAGLPGLLLRQPPARSNPRPIPVQSPSNPRPMISGQLAMSLPKMNEFRLIPVELL